MPITTSQWCVSMTLWFLKRISSGVSALTLYTFVKSPWFASWQRAATITASNSSCESIFSTLNRINSYVTNWVTSHACCQLWYGTLLYVSLISQRKRKSFSFEILNVFWSLNLSKIAKIALKNGTPNHACASKASLNLRLKEWAWKEFDQTDLFRYQQPILWAHILLIRAWQCP